MEATQPQPVPTPAIAKAIIKMVAETPAPTPAPWWAEDMTLADLVGTAEDRRFDF